MYIYAFPQKAKKNHCKNVLQFQTFGLVSLFKNEQQTEVNLRHLILTQSSQKEQHTSLQDATALCKGVNHLLSLALTLAPVTKNKNNRNLTGIYRMTKIFSRRYFQKENYLLILIK